MKTAIRLSALAVAAMLSSACSPEDDGSAATRSASSVTPAGAEASPSATSGAAEEQAASATGTVTAIDAGTGTITIEHGPVPALEWPAMTMGFAATHDQSSQIAPGQRVEFTFVMRGNKATITEITTID